jgi:uncharacterized membrane protein
MTDTTSPAQVGTVPRQIGAVSARRLGALWIGAGLIGLTAAIALLVEKIELLVNPDYIPTCNVSPILSCGSVMTTPQAEAFGIPNPIIGIVGFSAIAVAGGAVLAGNGFRLWFWGATQLGVTFAVVFIHWLIYQSLYVIGALCPYCMIVWAVTIPLFWYTTVFSLRHLEGATPRWVRRCIEIATGYHGVILTVWVLVVIALIANRFWDYWSSLV